MSMPSVKFAGPGHIDSGTSSLSGVVSVLRRGLVAFGSGMVALGHSFRVAQLASALNHFSDAQLAEIGITRSEILSHAEKLMAADKDMN